MSKSKKVVLVSFFLCLIALIGVAVGCFPYAQLSLFCDNATVTASELNDMQNKGFFGPIVSVKLKDGEVVNTSAQSTKYNPVIEFRLFNLIPIKRQQVKILTDDKVLMSGSAIGLVLKTKGVLVVGSSPISTAYGDFDVLKSSDLKLGDVITQIENESVENVPSIAKIINEKDNLDRELEIKFVRDGREMSTRVKPCFDVNSHTYKLGIWARDDASGIGTLTFIGKNNRFGALGHPICDSDTKSKINLKEGRVYDCTILGVNRGECGNPGEIKGLFMQGKNSQGIVEKNNNYGIFGNINEDSDLFDTAREIEVGGRLSVKPGKAQIRCNIDGDKVETFDIEIIKTNYQTSSSAKSMVLRVTDKDLIRRTGGIVQGMSGSPIIQNGKIVGAVTHVFVSDPTKGFGVYIDWMLDE